jgi:cyclase
MVAAPRSSPHFRLETIADGVHVAVARDGGFALSNGTILDLGGITVVFDSLLTPTAGLDLRRAAERLTGRPPDFLVNSHYHGDHVRGNAAFAPAHIVSTAATRELLTTRATAAAAEDRAAARKELASLRKNPAVVPARDRELLEGWYRGLLATPARLQVPVPDLLIEPELVLAGTKRSLRILTFGGGHSPSDVLAYVPEDRIVVLGDLLSIGYHPCLWDGHPGRLREILGKVGRLGVEQAVPGHGPVGGPPDLRRFDAYVAGLFGRARAIRRDRRRALRPGDAVAPSPFDDWKLTDYYRENLAFVVRRYDYLVAR